MRKIFDKRIYFTVLTALTISGFMVICTLGQTIRQKRIDTKLAAAATEEQDDPLYILKEHEGRIAIFCRGMAEPYRYLDYSVSLLPEYDREQLREGIAFDTEQELKMYLQDVET